MVLLNHVFKSVDRQTDCWLSDPESLRKRFLSHLQILRRLETYKAMSLNLSSSLCLQAPG